MPATPTATTAAFGVLHAELAVPRDARTGDYRVRLSDGTDTIAEVPIRVERFELPRFRVSVAPSARAVRAGDSFGARVVAERFDASAVGGAALSVALRGKDAGLPPLARWEGLTDHEGAADVTLDVPADVSSGLPGTVLEVTVRDAGGRSVREAVELAWAGVGEGARPAKPRVLLPDGPLAAGVPSRVLVRTDLPEGAEVLVGATGLTPPQLRPVDALGFVEVAVHDPVAGMSVRVGDGSAAVEVAPAPLALVLGRRVLAHGESLPVRVHTTTNSSAVYVDLLREDGAVATFALPVVAGRAEAELRLPAHVVGPITVQAYVLPPAGPQIAIARTAFVVPPERLRLRLAPSAAAVEPGAPVRLDIRATDLDGRGVACALGVRVADEAVLSLARLLPDCARAALVTNAPLLRLRDEVTERSAAALLAAAGRRRLSTAEARLTDVLLARGDRVSKYGVDARSLPGREQQYVRRVAAQMKRFAETFGALAAEVLPIDAPPPSAEVPTIAAALDGAAALCAFGRDGLLDPWGSPLQVTLDGTALPFDWADGDVFPSDVSLVLRSPGPDGAARTRDDVSFELSASQTLALHVRWVRAHGHVFDEDSLRSQVIVGGGAGGAFGGRGGGHRNLRAGGGGRKTGVALAPVTTRTRCFFPEAAYFGPLVLTDAAGRAHILFAAPDSLTTWRVDAVASDAAGRAADGETSFRTLLPFVAEIDPPDAMFVGDEVEIPVVLRWDASAERAHVVADVSVSREGRLLTPARMSVASPASGEGAFVVRVRALVAGAMQIHIRCASGKAADASERVVTVLPPGRPEQVACGVRVGPGGANVTLPRPSRTLPGSGRVELRIHPGRAAQLAHGVDGLLRQPHGCFEQASSTLYPDVLALAYLADSKDLTPALGERFATAIRQGIDLLLSYEVPGGGYDWFGKPPAKLLLSAYGLHEWWSIQEAASARGSPAWAEQDRASQAGRRCAQWLVSQQEEDGSFADAGAPYEWRGKVSGRVAATAYVGWALARSPDAIEGDAVGRAREYVLSHIDEVDDPYALALATVFLLERDPKDPGAMPLARRLAALAQPRDGALRLAGGSGSAFHGKGRTASIETTALAALAAHRLLDPDVLAPDGFLQALAEDRHGDGTWGTTQATVLALWALVQARTTAIPAGNEIVVRPRGGWERRFVLAAQDVARPVCVDLAEAAGGEGPIEVFVAHGAPAVLTGTLVFEHTVPFDDASPHAAGRLALAVTPGTRTPDAGAPLDLVVRLTNATDTPVAMPLIEVPLAAGMLPDLVAMQALRGRDDIGRIEADARKIVVYLRELGAGATFECTLAVTPRLRGTVLFPQAEARPYYEPDARAFGRHAVLDVR